MERRIAGDFEEYRRADIRFHIALAETARSLRLVTEMTEVQASAARGTTLRGAHAQIGGARSRATSVSGP